MNFFTNSNKMFFLFMLFFSTMISISSNSWLGCWIGLEINLLSFIPLISNVNNLFSSEASLKYFLIQSIASMNFLFFILMKMFFFKNFFSSDFLMILMNSTLLMKMGSAPFHMWFPNIMEGMSWFNCFILMTWQKITPIILLSYYFNILFILIISILNIIMGALGGINQTSIRKILAFSSINNLGWMLMAIMISENLWIFYFIIYSFLNLMMCSTLYSMNSFFLPQLFSYNINPYIKLSLFMNLLSMGGLPPFLGFFPKWMMINFLIFNKFIILTFFFIMMSLIMLFFYIRIMYSSFIFNYFKLKWFKVKIKNKTIKIINLYCFITLLGLPISTFFFI